MDDRRTKHGLPPQELKASKEGREIILGIVPCLNHLFVDKAWNLIKPHVENIARQTMGEYTAYKVWESIFYGSAHLYLCYMGDENIDSQALVLDRLVNNPKENWVGYFLIRPDPTCVHIWQAHIQPEFQGHDVIDMGLAFLEQNARNIGAPALSFSAYQDRWSKAANTIGFKKTATIYRKEL